MINSRRESGSQPHETKVTEELNTVPPHPPSQSLCQVGGGGRGSLRMEQWHPVPGNGDRIILISCVLLTVVALNDFTAV